MLAPEVCAKVIRDGNVVKHLCDPVSKVELVWYLHCLPNNHANKSSQLVPKGAGQLASVYSDDRRDAPNVPDISAYVNEDGWIDTSFH